MIRDGAPPEWSPLMRLVAGEIADDAGDPCAHPLKDGELPWSAVPVEGEFRHGRWRDGLTERCGMSARAISRVLTELAAAGYEMRQPITGREGKPVTDKRGRILFTAPGRALRFQVPPLTPRPEPERSPDLASVDDARSPEVATETEGRSPDPATEEGERSPLPASTVAESGDPISSVPPQDLSPHENQSPQPTLLASVADAEARPVAPDEEKTDSGGPQECRYAQCRIRTPVPVGSDMHEGCERFAALKAQAARLPAPFTVPAERRHTKAS
jgi:hypothetical protein